MANGENKLGYVDAARGIAILMVIVVHQLYVPGMSPLVVGLSEYGQMGVQLFFVASAYTLCISEHRREAEPAHVASFYIRRYFRIAPLYYLAIALYGLLQVSRVYFTARYAAGLNLQAVDLTGNYSLSNIVANVLFIHGFVPAANNAVVPGGWSIGTEMAFYAIFPLLFYVVVRVLAGRVSMVIALLVGVLAIDVAVNFTLSRVYGVPIGRSTFVYFNLLNQLPVFLIGMIAFLRFYLPNAPITAATAVRDIVLFGVFTAISAALWLSGDDLAFSFIPVVSGISFAFLLNLLRSLPWRLTPIEKIGQVSYSMYVFHFLFADVMARLPVKLLGPAPSYPTLIYFMLLAVSIACTYAAAVASKRWLEYPGIELGRRMIAQLRLRRAAA